MSLTIILKIHRISKLKKTILINQIITKIQRFKNKIMMIKTLNYLI